jgi:hypothetical protein
MNITRKGYLSTESLKFDYVTPAPLSTKINILTKGNVCITSHWEDGIGHKGWAPLPSRDHEEEKRLNLI